MTPDEPSGPAMSHARAAVRAGDVIYSRLAPVGDRESVGAMLERNVSRLADRPVFCERRDGRYAGVTWLEFATRVASFARFLGAHGVGAGARVAVVSPNRGEMLVAEMATMCIGATYVPIFAAYPADQLQALIGKTAPAALLVAGLDQLQRAGVPDTARLVVSFDAITPSPFDAVMRGRGVSQMTYDYVVLALPASVLRRVPITPALPAQQHDAIARVLVRYRVDVRDHREGHRTDLDGLEPGGERPRRGCHERAVERGAHLERDRLAPRPVDRRVLHDDQARPALRPLHVVIDQSVGDAANITSQVRPHGGHHKSILELHAAYFYRFKKLHPDSPSTTQ